MAHWKLGSLKTNAEYSQYLTVYDEAENGTQIMFHDIWKSVDQHTDLTVWTTKTYFKVFLILVVIHFIAVFVVKYYFAMNFRPKTERFAKFYHILNQIMCPTSYKDWDEEIKTIEDVKMNWKQVSKEMKVLLGLFACEHIILCFPIWILSYNIYKRNLYLDSFFPQVQEEHWSTTLAYSLSVLCPIAYMIVPFFQYGLFLLYHKFGHPWSQIFNAQFEDVNNEQDIDIDETSFIGNLVEAENDQNTKSEHRNNQDSEFANAFEIENSAEETVNLIQTGRKDGSTETVKVIIENNQRENLELKQE